MPRRREEGVATRVEQAAATREALINAARLLWGKQGFFGTTTEEIVKSSGVGTRGALYHHFSDREDLFLAVFDAVQAELSTALTPVASDADPVTRLRNVLLAFLDLVADRPDAQALLIDGPAVFGWRGWRELESQRGLAALEILLKDAARSIQIADPLVEPLAALLLGLMTDAALLVATSDDPDRARADTADALARLLDGLR